MVRTGAQQVQRTPRVRVVTNVIKVTNHNKSVKAKKVGTKVAKATTVSPLVDSLMCKEVTKNAQLAVAKTMRGAL